MNSTPDSITQPTLPDPGTIGQSLVSAFGTLGTYVFAIIAAAVGLGIAIVVAVILWRNFRKWTGRTSS